MILTRLTFLLLLFSTLYTKPALARHNYEYDICDFIPMCRPTVVQRTRPNKDVIKLISPLVDRNIGQRRDSVGFIDLGKLLEMINKDSRKRKH